MRRRAIDPRPNWREQADAIGFPHAEIGGVPYWDESAVFEFELDEIEFSIEEPTRELHEMCLDFASVAARDARLLTSLGVPPQRHDDVAASWAARDTDLSLYGRFDLAYDGQRPAKLLEYNADTPTALFETAVLASHQARRHRSRRRRRAGALHRRGRRRYRAHVQALSMGMDIHERLRVHA